MPSTRLHKRIQLFNPLTHDINLSAANLTLKVQTRYVRFRLCIIAFCA